ncbi:MAG: hypothetical protein KBC33_02025 [Candidatus Pacebacteria bacterium]|nr:hypothetical protein [Candidatus Paceibacterota bacterium]
MKSLLLTEEPLHHAHRSFMLNMSRAAGEPFEQSAIKWRVDRLGYSGEKMNCQVCNTALNNYVVLVNTRNNNRIIIGHNCYDKLMQFIRTGKVQSTLGDRQAYTENLRKSTAEIVNRTVIGWFREELDARKITDESLAQIVSHIEDFGFAPSVEDAQKLVEYYKDHRLVFVEKVVPEARTWRLRKFIPNHIRVGYVDRLYALIKRSEEISRDLAILPALHATVIPRLEEMLEEVRGLIKFGQQDAVITEELELIVERIEELVGPCNQRWFARVAISETKELEWWIDQVRPLTWCKVRVFRSLDCRFYRLDFSQRVWVEIPPHHVIGGELITASSLYDGYYSRYHSQVVVTNVRAGFANQLRIVKFDRELPEVPGSYTGRMGGKKVLSMEPIPSGTYLALLVEKIKGGSLVFAA